MLSFSKIKYFLLTIFGFSLAGGLWGFECFLGTVGSDEVISNPFSFILGALFLGFFGNLSLIFFLEKDFKKILKFLFLGIFCWLISFLIVGIFAHPLWMIGGIITFLPELFFDIGTIEKYISLQPSLDITYFWLEFLISGIIVSLFLSFWLKLRKKPLILKISLGFFLASIISPIFGNLIGNFLFKSLFLAYLLTFSLIGAIFGLSFSLAISKNKVIINL